MPFAFNFQSLRIAYIQYRMYLLIINVLLANFRRCQKCLNIFLTFVLIISLQQLKATLFCDKLYLWVLIRNPVFYYDITNKMMNEL